MCIVSGMTIFCKELQKIFSVSPENMVSQISWRETTSNTHAGTVCESRFGGDYMCKYLLNLC